MLTSWFLTFSSGVTYAGFQALIEHEHPFCSLCKAVAQDMLQPQQRTKCRDNATYMALLGSNSR